MQFNLHLFGRPSRNVQFLTLALFFKWLNNNFAFVNWFSSLNWSHLKYDIVASTTNLI